MYQRQAGKQQRHGSNRREQHQAIDLRPAKHGQDQHHAHPGCQPQTVKLLAESTRVVQPGLPGARQYQANQRHGRMGCTHQASQQRHQHGLEARKRCLVNLTQLTEHLRQGRLNLLGQLLQGRL